MDRRTFLRTLGVLAGTGALAACGRAVGDSGTVSIPEGEPALSVVNASFETLPGRQRRMNLVVFESDRTPIEGANLSTFVRALDGEVRSGPHPVTWYDESGTGTGTGVGLYQTILPLEQPGTYEIVAVQGDRYGVAAVNVVDPALSQAPVPGAPAIATPTPTMAADLGVAEVCTQDPACGMHEVSLDEAMAAGRPVMLLFATPAYCQTAACGPVVASLDTVRGSQDWGDTAFIHAEIYAQPPSGGVGNTQLLAPPVLAWNLPTEPWLFAIGPDGVITDRMDGPMLRQDMARIAETLT